jgi:hypothetical protein
VLDISNPASVVPLSALDSAGGYDLFMTDSLVFASGYYTGAHEFQIINVRDSVHPTRVGGCNTPGDGWAVWVNRAAARAYVADPDCGLAFIDITTPPVPVLDTAILRADMAMDVAVQGNLAFVADYTAGLKVLDLTDPTTPTEIGHLDTATFVSAEAVTAKDSFAYAGWWWTPEFRVISVSNPESPVSAGGCSTFNQPLAIAIRDSFAYCAEVNRFQIVNVARPREPVLVGSCNTQDGVYFGLAVQDSLAYLISGSLQILDVADPASPTIIGTTSVFGSGVAVRDTFVYVPYGYDTLRVYSCADPEDLRLLGFAPLQAHTDDVALAESVALVATFNGLEAFSLEDPAHPHWRAAISTPYAPRRVVYAAPYFYTAMWDAGVGIYSAESLGLQERVSPMPQLAGLSAAPNPTRGRCLVSFGKMRAGQVGLRDAGGRVVPTAVIRRETGLSFDLSKLAAGVYFVEVRTDRRISSAKIVKQ